MHRDHENEYRLTNSQFQAALRHAGEVCSDNLPDNDVAIVDDDLTANQKAAIDSFMRELDDEPAQDDDPDDVESQPEQPEAVAIEAPASEAVAAPVEPADALTANEMAAVIVKPDEQARSIDIVSLAPGCYGMSMCYRPGSDECSTCPFASTCKPLAEGQAKALVGHNSVADIEREQDKIWRRNDRVKKKAEAASAPTRAPAPVVKAAPPSSPSKVLLDALRKSVENRHSTDRRLEKMTDPQKQKEYVAVAIISWLKPELSAAKIAELYNASTGKTGKHALDKKKVENRMARVKTLVDTGIWKPLQSGAKP